MAEADGPNVLFVLSDQQRAAAMGCMGNEQVQTPTFDRMAAEGVLCTRNYSADPVCTPARGSILTGQYPHEHRAISNNFRLPESSTTVANVLQAEGYETAYIGKWHLDGTPKPGHVPPGERRQGFDHWRGFNRGHQHLRGHPHVRSDGSVEWTEGYQPTVQTDMAIDFMDEAADGDDPFFCFLSWGPPHLPYEAPAEYEARYDADDLELRPNVPERMADQARRDLVPYYGMVTSLDDQLERLLGALEDRGIAEDTLVVFTSDHGELIGSHGEYYKGQHWEESIHVPLLWRYPAGLPAGGECEAVTSLVDLMPTILSLCGAEIPAGISGRSLVDALRGDAALDRDGVYIEHGVGQDGGWRALRTEDRLLAVDRDGEVTYYFNTEDDPYQEHNLADLIHGKRPMRRNLIDAAKRYDDRPFLTRIGERPQ